MTLSIGIDIGTSAVKAVLLENGSRLIAASSIQLPAQISDGRWVEQDPTDWLEATRDALKILAASNPAEYAAVCAIGLSGQMHGAVLVGEDGFPLRHAILWNDSRSDTEATELDELYPDFAMIAGVTCASSFVAPKIKWLTKHEPEIIKLLRHLLLPKDYVRLWLTGEYATDMSDAAGTWMFDQSSRKWSKPIIAAICMNYDMLPALFEGSSVTGTLGRDAAEILGLRKGIIVAAGAGDAAAGAIGLGAIQDGDCIVSIGTSSQLQVTTKDYRPEIASCIHAFAHGLPNLWYQMGAMLNGGSALAWWSEICDKSADQLIDEASNEDGLHGGTLFLPYLAGERTPHNDSAATAAFSNITLATGRSDLTKAVLEGVAFTLADAKAAMQASGSQFDTISLTGDGSKSTTWSQIIADVLNVTVVCHDSSQSSAAVGAARLACLAKGRTAAEDVCLKPPISASFEPKVQNHERFEGALSKWRALYKKASEINA